MLPLVATHVLTTHELGVDPGHIKYRVEKYQPYWDSNLGHPVQRQILSIYPKPDTLNHRGQIHSGF